MLPDKDDIPVPGGAKFSFISSLCTKEKRVSQNPPAEAGLELAWVGRFFPTVKVLFPPFWSYLIRTWSTPIQQRDLLQQLWPKVEFSVPPWGKQKSFSSSWTWKSSRQPHWKGRFWMLELRIYWCTTHSDMTGLMCLLYGFEWNPTVWHRGPCPQGG